MLYTSGTAYFYEPSALKLEKMGRPQQEDTTGAEQATGERAAGRADLAERPMSVSNAVHHRRGAAPCRGCQWWGLAVGDVLEACSAPVTNTPKPVFAARLICGALGSRSTPC